MPPANPRIKRCQKRNSPAQNTWCNPCCEGAEALDAPCSGLFAAQQHQNISFRHIPKLLSNSQTGITAGDRNRHLLGLRYSCLARAAKEVRVQLDLDSEFGGFYAWHRTRCPIMCVDQCSGVGPRTRIRADQVPCKGKGALLVPCLMLCRHSLPAVRKVLLQETCPSPQP